VTVVCTGDTRFVDLQRLGTGGPVLKFRTLLRTRLPAAASTDTTVLWLLLIAAVEVPSAVNGRIALGARRQPGLTVAAGSGLLA